MSSSSDVTARIFVESGGWGLPTIDPESLASIALLRFANIPFSICPGAAPSMTSANVLPVVIFDRKNSSEPSMCAGLPSLIALFTADKTLPDPNGHLTPFMIAESNAFATLVTARFGPARLYEFFVNDKNYADIYHTLLEKDSTFPLNRLLPFLRRREIKAQLKAHKPDALYFDAGIALAALATRLGETNKFFYQDQPSVLDAIVFGYLAPVVFVPLPSSELRSLVAQFSRLVAFVNRVRQQFFVRDGDRLDGELDGDSIIEARWQEVEKKARSASNTDDASRRRQSSSQSTEESISELERKKWNQYFIWGSIAVFAVHVLLGNEIEFEYE